MDVFCKEEILREEIEKTGKGWNIATVALLKYVLGGFIFVWILSIILTNISGWATIGATNAVVSWLKNAPPEKIGWVITHVSDQEKVTVELRATLEELRKTKGAEQKD